MKAVQAAGLEGVVAKRRNSVYQPGERSGDWVKLKLEKAQEFVIGGYRPDGLQGVDALLVGYYEDDALHFGGKVRAGMVPHIRRELVKLLRPLRSTECPFANLPDSSSGRWGGGVTADQMREMVAARQVSGIERRQTSESNSARRVALKNAGKIDWIDQR